MNPPRADAPQRLNLLAAGLFALTMLLMPAIQAAQFASTEFYPGSSSTSIVFSIWTWFFLYVTLLAWGSLRVRPKAEREDLHRILLGCVCGQAAVFSFVHLALFLRHVTGDGPPYGSPGPFYLLICVYLFLIAPILAGVHCRFSHRGGVLLLGQVLPVLWMMFAFATGLAFET